MYFKKLSTLTLLSKNLFQRAVLLAVETSTSAIRMYSGSLKIRAWISSYIKANKLTKIVADRYSPKILLQNPTIWVSTDSPGPQQPRFDILSWLWTTWKLRTPRVPGGPFAIFVRNPNNMGVYRLPWTPAIAIWHFELTQDHLNTEDTEGARRSLCFSCSKPLQYGCLYLFTAIKIWHFELT